MSTRPFTQVPPIQLSGRAHALASLLAAALLPLLLLLISCSRSTGRHPGKSPSPSAVETTAALARVDAVTTIPVADGSILSLVTWDHYVAWAASDDTSQGSQRITVHDLDTHATRVVARSVYKKGEADWVRGSRDTVIYTDLAEIPSDEDFYTPWKMFAVDLKTGDKQMFAASSSKLEELHLPLPEFEWPWVVWIGPPSTPQTDPQKGDLVAYDVGKGQKRVVVSSEPFKAWVTGGMVVYDDGPAVVPRDLFTKPIDISAPARQLTTSGRVTAEKAANGAVTWQEPPTGDPDSLWVEKLSPGEKPLKFASAGNNAFPGEDFVIYYSRDGQLLALPLGPGGRAILEDTSALNVGARWWVWKDRLVWATFDRPNEPDKSPSTIHVARMVKD